MDKIRARDLYYNDTELFNELILLGNKIGVIPDISLFEYDKLSDKPEPYIETSILNHLLKYIDPAYKIKTNGREVKVYGKSNIFAIYIPNYPYEFIPNGKKIDNDALIIEAYEFGKNIGYFDQIEDLVDNTLNESEFYDMIDKQKETFLKFIEAEHNLLLTDTSTVNIMNYFDSTTRNEYENYLAKNPPEITPKYPNFIESLDSAVTNEV